jgi:hypothetical protein
MYVPLKSSVSVPAFAQSEKIAWISWIHKRLSSGNSSENFSHPAFTENRYEMKGTELMHAAKGLDRWKLLELLPLLRILRVLDVLEHSR